LEQRRHMTPRMEWERHSTEILVHTTAKNGHIFPGAVVRAKNVV
jgi:hypothetical protein